MKKLVLDFDDVIVNFVDNWLLWLHTENISEKRYLNKDVLYYTWFIDMFGSKSRNFFLDDPIDCYKNKLNIFPGAKEFYDWCNEHFEVEIVTHACKIETEIAKTAFAKKHLSKDVKIRFFSVLEEKVNHIAGGILIDDYPFHAIKHSGINKQKSIIFDFNGNNGWSKTQNYLGLIKEYNTNPDLLYYTQNYNEIKNILKDLK